MLRSVTGQTSARGNHRLPFSCHTLLTVTRQFLCTLRRVNTVTETVESSSLHHLTKVQRTPVCRTFQHSSMDISCRYSHTIIRQAWHWRIPQYSCIVQLNRPTIQKLRHNRPLCCCTKKVVDSTDDGATDVSAAFGRIRLSGSIPECRRAAEYALDYCRRVKDSPCSSVHWRIPLNSKKFFSAVGR